MNRNAIKIFFFFRNVVIWPRDLWCRCLDRETCSQFRYFAKSIKMLIIIFLANFPSVDMAQFSNL